ncbi:SMI1/KNR4 family protein [Streptomyces sp. SBT349]|uniref:SMI1/KNR4 family protein n=1 Tax=Streptomyces sp. SBT349 TaxID=1580539 RepID=UPI00066D6DFC|nr:SMI1/KNR4 family protein [Streptomyces sp. SBT349]
MASGLDKLKAWLGEPEHWGRARPRLWEASERYLGVRLPSDYKAFLDLYGPGAVDGYLSLHRPTGTARAEQERLWSCETWRRARRSAPGLFPYPFHPEEGGLIAWGYDEHGGSYFFLAREPDPDQWGIVAAGEEGEWYETAGTFTDFLVRCFERRDRPPFMDLSWPRPHARYESHA